MSTVNVNYLQQKSSIVAASQKYNVPYGILAGVYGMETDFGNNVATSSAGAIGPFQFLPSTAGGYGYPLTNNPNPSQFHQQADAEAHYLSDLFKQHGNWDAALRAYSGNGYGLSQVSAKAVSLQRGNSAYSGGGVSPGAAMLGGSLAGGAAIVGASLAGSEAAVATAGDVAGGGAAGADAAAAGASGASSLSTLSQVKQGLGIAALISALMDPQHLLRFLMVIGGAALIIITIVFMLKTQVMGK